MTVLFLSTLLLGLILGVRAMLVGVERPTELSRPGQTSGPIVSRESLAVAAARISARIHVPVIAAFATAFGTVGYPLSRYTGWRPAWQLAVASAAGALAAVGAVLLVARWAVPSARRDVPDERYLLQGTFARVTEPIDRAHPGRIALEMYGTLHAVEAVSLSGDAIDRDTEVVIERIEGATAFVEPWSVVEGRL